VDGGHVPDQRRLDLPGYPGGFDLIGNWVNKQFQLDALGESLLLFAAAARHGRLDSGAWRAARIAADAIAYRWQEPDAGIWELEDQEWTHSRLTCVAGLRAAAGAGRQAAGWSALADTILADVAARATHPSGRWQRSPADPSLDSALLLAPVRGALPADDPHTLVTLRACLEELTEDMMALALNQQGNKVEAARWFERNRAACGPAGLFAEEYDVRQRQLRGNLPQAFVHALMLECSARLAGPPGAA
jgi:alpha,alpha-trehalase